MAALTQQLESMDRQLADALGEAELTGEVRVGSDDDLIVLLQTLGRLQRRLDSAITTVADRVAERDRGERVTRLSTAAGCRDAVDLLRRMLYIDGRSARRYVAAAAGCHRSLDITSNRPTVVQDDVVIDLPDERDQLTTRSDPRFVELRHHIYGEIQRAKTHSGDNLSQTA